MAADHQIADAATLAAARAGDRSALASVWRIYQPQILRFLHSRRCDAAEDVASLVWLDVARAFDRFDGDGVAFQRWLFTIARHRSIDQVRRTRRRAERSIDAVELVGSITPAVDEDPTARPGDVDDALKLLARLPVPQAEAIMLRVVADLDVSAAAEIMQTSESNVRVLVHRGLTRLRRELSVGLDEGLCNGDRPRNVSVT